MYFASASVSAVKQRSTWVLVEASERRWSIQVTWFDLVPVLADLSGESKQNDPAVDQCRPGQNQQDELMVAGAAVGAAAKNK